MATPEPASNRTADQPAAAPLLEVSDLRVNYGAVSAIRGVSLSVAAGEVVALLGANGAGKSTLLRTVSGLIRPRAGRITLGGEPIHRLPPARIVRLGIAHCPEGRRVFGTLSVAENLRLGAAARADRTGIAADRDKIYAMFPILAERMSQAAGTLSGGEQQMLAMARALMARPRVLLLDEPSLGLAPIAAAEVLALAQEIARSGVGVVLAEQNIRGTLGACDRVYWLQRGRIAASGEAAAYRDRPDLVETLLGT